MGAIIGIIVGCLIVAAVFGGIASAIDGSQERDAEKNSDIFLENVHKVCEKDGIEYKEPKSIKITLPNNFGYRFDYENEVKVNYSNETMEVALYWIDEEKNELCFVSSNKSFIIDIDKIKMYTLNGSIRYNSIIKNDGKNISLSGAIIGSAIAGPAGMVIGATKDRNNITTDIEETDERKVYIYYENEHREIKMASVEKCSWCEHFGFDDFMRKEFPDKSDIYLTAHQDKNNKPIYIEDLTPEQLNQELEKGYKDIKEGRTFSQEEAERILKK